MAGMGALERALMEDLWDADAPLPVRDLRDRLNACGDRQLAYNTVQTVLDRLARKGLVVRSQEGRAHLCSPARSHEDHVAAIMLEALSDTRQRRAVLGRFAELVDARDARALLQVLTARSTRRRSRG